MTSDVPWYRSVFLKNKKQLTACPLSFDLVLAGTFWLITAKSPRINPSSVSFALKAQVDMSCLSSDWRTRHGDGTDFRTDGENQMHHYASLLSCSSKIRSCSTLSATFHRAVGLGFDIIGQSSDTEYACVFLWNWRLHKSNELCQFSVLFQNLQWPLWLMKLCALTGCLNRVVRCFCRRLQSHFR